LRPLDIEPFNEWGEWADQIWKSFRTTCAFTVNREVKNLREMYPLNDPRLLRFVMKRDRHPVAWAVVLNTRMREDKYFGDLQVATILDCLCAPGEFVRAIRAVSDVLAGSGSDLTITNQSHPACQSALRQAGFLVGPSNYLVGLSKAISDQASNGAIHITRGDGDGRMHL